MNKRIEFISPEEFALLLKNCKDKEDYLNKAYSTEMFETLVKGEKVCVFASNINKIKFSYQDNINWEFIEDLEEEPNLRTLNNIFNSYKRDGGKKKCCEIKFKASKEDVERFYGKLEEVLLKTTSSYYLDKKNKKARAKLLRDFDNNYRKFIVEANTREIKNILQLKQQYMVKII